MMENQAFKSPKTGRLDGADFENCLAGFRQEILDFLEEIDPGLESGSLKISRNIPTISIPEAHPERWDAGIYARNRADLDKGIFQQGPRVVEGDIFGEQVILGQDVRVKGNVFGFKGVEVGENCVIEGDLISDGKVIVQKNCRVEGSIIGGELELVGPLMVRALIYSRDNLNSTGGIKASSLNAGGHIIFREDEPGEISLDAPIILSRKGDIGVGQVVRLAGSLMDPARQKFFILWNGGQFQLSPTPFEVSENEATQGALVTVLTDNELEKMVAELAVFKVSFNFPPGRRVEE